MLDVKGRKARRGRRGRPRLPGERGKRHTLSLRVTDERRHDLENAAAQSGRSISQELEMRIEQGVREEEILGGAEMVRLFRMMAAAAQLIETRAGPGKTWFSDYEVFVSVREAWSRIIDSVLPQPSEALRDSLAAATKGLVDHLEPFNKNKKQSLDATGLLALYNELQRFDAHLTHANDIARRFIISPLVPANRPDARKTEE